MIQHFRRSTGTSLAARLTMDPKIFNCKQVSFAAVLVQQIWRTVIMTPGVEIARAVCEKIVKLLSE